jgi:hypothetical protein
MCSSFKSISVMFLTEICYFSVHGSSCLVMTHVLTGWLRNTQVALLEMWNRPYASTVVPDAQHLEMLWNAANDDPSTDMHSSQESSSGDDGFSDGSDDSDSGNSYDSNEDSGSESYMKYDTDSTSRFDQPQVLTSILQELTQSMLSCDCLHAVVGLNLFADISSQQRWE